MGRSGFNALVFSDSAINQSDDRVRDKSVSVSLITICRSV